MTGVEPVQGSLRNHPDDVIVRLGRREESSWQRVLRHPDRDRLLRSAQFPNRRDGIVDRETCFRLQPLRTALQQFSVNFTLSLRNSSLQSIHVGGDFRFYRIPISTSCVANGFEVLVHFFDRCRRGNASLLLACHDLIMRFPLRCRRSVLCILSTNRQVSELFREFLGHVTTSIHGWIFTRSELLTNSARFQFGDGSSV